MKMDIKVTSSPPSPVDVRGTFCADRGREQGGPVDTVPARYV